MSDTKKVRCEEIKVNSTLLSNNELKTKINNLMEKAGFITLLETCDLGFEYGVTGNEAKDVFAGNAGTVLNKLKKLESKNPPELKEEEVGKYKDEIKKILEPWAFSKGYKELEEWKSKITKQAKALEDEGNKCESKLSLDEVKSLGATLSSIAGRALGAADIGTSLILGGELQNTINDALYFLTGKHKPKYTTYLSSIADALKEEIPSAKEEIPSAVERFNKQLPQLMNMLNDLWARNSRWFKEELNKACSE